MPAGLDPSRTTQAGYSMYNILEPLRHFRRRPFPPIETHAHISTILEWTPQLMPRWLRTIDNKPTLAISSSCRRPITDFIPSSYALRQNCSLATVPSPPFHAYVVCVLSAKAAVACICAEAHSTQLRTHPVHDGWTWCWHCHPDFGLPPRSPPGSVAEAWESPSVRSTCSTKQYHYRLSRRGLAVWRETWY